MAGASQGSHGSSRTPRRASTRRQRRGSMLTNAVSSTGCSRKPGTLTGAREGMLCGLPQRGRVRPSLRWDGSTVSTGLAQLTRLRTLRPLASRVWTGRQSTANRPSLTRSGFRCTTWTRRKPCVRLVIATGPTVTIARVPWRSGPRRGCTRRRSAARPWTGLRSGAQRFGRERCNLPHPPRPQGGSRPSMASHPPRVLL